MKRLFILCVLLMMTLSGNLGGADVKLPEANVLSRLLWLGDTANRPNGSGTLVSHNGAEYLVTALHVFRGCGNNPSVRFREEWNPIVWEVVAEDEDLDVIVLKSAALPADTGERLPVIYGIPEGAIHGQIGYSLGFPGVRGLDGQPKTDHVPEINGRPIPIVALLVVNLSAKSRVQYSASVINAGFSGGAVVYHVAEQEMWTISGIITGFPNVPRTVYMRKKNETGLDTLHETEYVTLQHTGLVGYVPMSAVLQMIDDAVGKD